MNWWNGKCTYSLEKDNSHFTSHMDNLESKYCYTHSHPSYSTTQLV